MDISEGRQALSFVGGLLCCAVGLVIRDIELPCVEMDTTYTPC